MFYKNFSLNFYSNSTAYSTITLFAKIFVYQIYNFCGATRKWYYTQKIIISHLRLPFAHRCPVHKTSCPLILPHVRRELLTGYLRFDSRSRCSPLRRNSTRSSATRCVPAERHQKLNVEFNMYEYSYMTTCSGHIYEYLY